MLLQQFAGAGMFVPVPVFMLMLMRYPDRFAGSLATTFENIDTGAEFTTLQVQTQGGR